MCPLSYCRALHHQHSSILLVHYHYPPRKGLLTGLHRTSSGHPQRSKQTSALPCAALAPSRWHRAPQHILFLNSPLQSEAGGRAAAAQLAWVPPCQGDFLTQPDPCPRSQGRLKVKTRGKLESHPLPLTDANCSLSVNFREARISSVLFRISAGKAARYTQGEIQPCQLSKEATEILHCLYVDDTKHMCSNLLSAPFLFLFIAVSQHNLLDNSCCQRGRLGGLSCAQFEIIQVGALSSALKFLLFFQLPVQVLCLLPWLEQWQLKLNLTTCNGWCYCWKTSLMRSQSNPSVPAYCASLCSSL